jgi:hypothetical protein
LKQAKVCKLRDTCKVIGDSTWDGFRIPVCRQLRFHGYDVKCWQAKRGASEEQIAIDILTTPHTTLCIAAPNGNRLARQEEEWQPRWLKRTAGHIADALTKTSKRACVFVGEASLCPGVSNLVTYTTLVGNFREELRKLGVALVSTCPEVILQDDRIHWDIRSQYAVKSLFDRLVDRALDTSFFVRSPSVPLWHWKYDVTLEKYYPCCRTCNKWATDAHLTGKDHLLHGGGSQETFNFPNRLELNASGVKFTKRDDPSTLETSQFLPADYPLPTQTVRSILVTEMPACAESFVLDYGDSSVGVAPNTKLSKKTYCRIRWGDGECRKHKLNFNKSGRKRDAFTLRNSKLVVKAETVGKENRNKSEWDLYNSTPAIRDFIPEVYGYFEQTIGDKLVSFLLVRRVDLIFESMLDNMRKDEITGTSLHVLCTSVVQVLKTLTRAASNGIQLHDWHTGNVGFTDAEKCKCVTVDWEKNNLAPASLSYHGRMSPGVLSFARHLNYSEARNRECEARFREDEWWLALQRIAALLLAWWNTFERDNPRNDALPSADDFSELEKDFVEAMEIWMTYRSLPAVNTCDSNAASSSTAKRSRIEEHGPEGFLSSRSVSQAEDTAMVISDAIDFDEPSFFRTPDDDEEKEAVMHRIILECAGMTEDVADSCRAAVRHLMCAATYAQRKHVVEIYRHGRAVVVGQSMPLTQRLQENAFPHHDPRVTGVPMTDMDDVGNLLRPLHAGLKALPSVQKMQNPPQTAVVATWFHKIFAKKFLQKCNPPWNERSQSEKFQYLREWFLLKFSLHPQNICMLPRPGEPRKTRNEAAWLGVEITDQEMEKIIDDSFTFYIAESHVNPVMGL